MVVGSRGVSDGQPGLKLGIHSDMHVWAVGCTTLFIEIDKVTIYTCTIVLTLPTVSEHHKCGPLWERYTTCA
jgi:hypothetical protein